MSPVELLSPAGNFKTALAAFAAGADAVYCGLTDFSARAFADNFTDDDLERLLRYSRANGKKVYVTFNTLVDEADVESAIERLARLDELKPDALIIQDLGIARLCRTYFPDLVLHASTQMVAHNLEGVLALKELGFSRVVLAREVGLDEAASIARRCGVELECFVHGALCYSLSGLCLFGAMEKDRSGNRGKCPYCCRLPYETARGKCLPFSMKDLRLGEDVRKLADAGIASLKIEGRMKSELYVASVTRYYRQILRDEGRGMRDEGRGMRDEGAGTVSVSDLETVFSRRTTKLYFNGNPHASTFDHQSSTSTSNINLQPASPIDPDSLGHLGAEIGTVKRVTKDRDGLSWLRFHTARALEKHDGLQFEAMVDGKHLGMGITEMRPAISRHPVFEVGAGTDVEILLPDETELATVLKPGMKIYCSASQAVRRMFPEPSFRPSDYAGSASLDIVVTLARQAITATSGDVSVSVACALGAAKNPEKTFAAVEKAFSKLGETNYRLGRLTLNDPERLFAPMSVLNDVRRDLVERLDENRARVRRAKIDAALADADALETSASTGQDGFSTVSSGTKRVKIRLGQKVPAGDWNEVIVAVNVGLDESQLAELRAAWGERVRLALPVYTHEADFNRLRVLVKGLVRHGFVRWEASDLATLRLLKQVKVADVTADWTLFAFNLSALRLVSERGAKRFVASPENNRENLQFLAESGFPVEFLIQQSTPLFISLTRPAAFPHELACFARDGLWVTTKPVPRTFSVPDGVSTRLDLSWDPD